MEIDYVKKYFLVSGRIFGKESLFFNLFFSSNIKVFPADN